MSTRRTIALDDQLTTAQVAELAGIQTETLRYYVRDGRMPQPDGHVGRTPWWRTSTVERWLEGRPGRGVGSGGRPAVRRQAAAKRAAERALEPTPTGASASA